MKNGRPKINRELETAEKRLAEINAGLVACYETIAIGTQKKTALESKIANLRSLAGGE